MQWRILGIAELQSDETAQTGEHLGDRRAGLAARSDCSQFNGGMPRQQAQQFHPGVARASDDTHLDHFKLLAAKG